MLTLIFNAGSSSLRFALFDAKLKLLYKAHIDAIGQKTCQFRRYLANNKEQDEKIKIKNHQAAALYAMKRMQADGLLQNPAEIRKVGHRVVHGGTEFTTLTLLTKKTLVSLKKLSPLAPLHNPANLAGIFAALKVLPSAEHYAIFDTAFHHTLPPKAFLYGLPYALYEKEGLRRFGFHGTSHRFVSQEAEEILKKMRPHSKKPIKLISCHLGNGVSLAAIRDKKCVDTTMGYTPLEGPIMGTRSGSLDPGLVLHLVEKNGLKKTTQLLQKESGFLGLSGLGSDIRSLRAQSKTAGTQRTFDVFSYQMAKLITAFFVPLGGLPDAILFTAGIGENAFYLRKQILEYLAPLGVRINAQANKQNKRILSTAKSSIQIFVIPTNEELQMAKELNDKSIQSRVRTKPSSL